MKRYQNMKRGLQEGLATFGLNPSEWELEYYGQNIVRIKNMNDTTFQIYGQVRFKKNGLELDPDWAALSLVV